MTDLSTALRVVLDQAARQGVRIALVGGFAISVRIEPRFTRDIDVVVAVKSDAEAEKFVGAMTSEGHELIATVEQEAAGRLATARLRLVDGSLLDLLFASAGIESEIADEAEQMEVMPDVTVPVITVAHLIAVKVLARDDVRRPQDVVDLRRLLAVASQEDIDAARSALRLIADRGFGRGRDLVSGLEDLEAGR